MKFKYSLIVHSGYCKLILLIIAIISVAVPFTINFFDLILFSPAIYYKYNLS